MFKDLVRQNRSYRGFDETVTITREELLELVDCARICPSASNAQPLRYALIADKAGMDDALPLTHWAGKLPALGLPRPGHHPAAMIVVCVDSTVRNPAAVGTDIGIAAQTILLAAAEKGLGGCMIANFDHTGMVQLLKLPAPIAPVLVIALGKPDETVVLTDADGSIDYYRDENDVHYVPKRKLGDIIL